MLISKSEVRKKEESRITPGHLLECDKIYLITVHKWPNAEDSMYVKVAGRKQKQMIWKFKKFFGLIILNSVYKSKRYFVIMVQRHRHLFNKIMYYQRFFKNL